VHDREHPDSAREATIHDAEGKASTKVAAVGCLELGGDVGVVADYSEDAVDFVEEVPAETGGAIFIERGGLSKLRERGGM
jgi:hypothetical protein